MRARAHLAGAAEVHGAIQGDGDERAGEGAWAPRARHRTAAHNARTRLPPQTVYLPYEVTGLTGIVSSLPSVYGRRAPAVAATGGAAAAPRAAAGRRDDDFAALN